MPAASQDDRTELTSERETLTRHRANCVAHAVWGLYNTDNGQASPRRWLALAPKVLSKGKSGSGAGAVEVEMGDGTKTLGNNRLRTTKFGYPAYLPVRIPELKIVHEQQKIIDIGQHLVYLYKSDYERALQVMPHRWTHAWSMFEQSRVLRSPFGLVVKRNLYSASFRVNTLTADGLLCAALFMAEVCHPQLTGIESSSYQ